MIPFIYVYEIYKICNGSINIHFEEYISKCVAVVQLLSHVQPFASPWTVAHQAPLSMGFSKQEYWSGLPFLSPRALPDPEIEATSPALPGGFFTIESPGKPHIKVYFWLILGMRHRGFFIDFSYFYVYNNNLLLVEPPNHF